MSLNILKSGGLAFRGLISTPAPGEWVTPSPCSLRKRPFSAPGGPTLRVGSLCQVQRGTKAGGLSLPCGPGWPGAGAPGMRIGAHWLRSWPRSLNDGQSRQEQRGDIRRCSGGPGSAAAPRPGVAPMGAGQGVQAWPRPPTNAEGDDCL